MMDIKISKRDLVKLGVNALVYGGVGLITANAIKQFTPPASSVKKNVQMWVGGLALELMICDKVCENVNNTIDFVADGYIKLRDKMRQTKPV